MSLEEMGMEPFSVPMALGAGISPRTLYRLRDAGIIEKLGPGVYRRADAPVADLDFLELAFRAPNATICLSSALARYGLIDSIPHRIDTAIPRGTTPPVVSAPVQWHRFDASTFGLERTKIGVPGSSLQIGIYTPERSVVEAFRLRGQEGYEVGISALKSWLRLPGSHPAELLKIAKQLPRATGPLRTALEILT